MSVGLRVFLENGLESKIRTSQYQSLIQTQVNQKVIFPTYTLKF